ncbi:hypothetical protein ACOMHN_001261 [Nucella lapillus]
MSETTITKADLTTLKGFTKPPQLVKDTLTVTLILLGEPESKAMNYANILKFLASGNAIGKLASLKADMVPAEVVRRAKDLTKDHDVNKIRNVSSAVVSFYQWNQSIIQAVLPGSS